MPEVMEVAEALRLREEDPTERQSSGVRQKKSSSSGVCCWYLLLPPPPRGPLRFDESDETPLREGTGEEDDREWRERWKKKKYSESQRKVM